MGDRTEFVFVTPLDGAFTSGLLADKHIELVTGLNVGEVDGAGVLRSFDACEEPFDLPVTRTPTFALEWLEAAARPGGP